MWHLRKGNYYSDADAGGLFIIPLRDRMRCCELLAPSCAVMYQRAVCPGAWVEGCFGLRSPGDAAGEPIASVGPHSIHNYTLPQRLCAKR
jgi:hypothetical protein